MSTVGQTLAITQTLALCGTPTLANISAEAPSCPRYGCTIGCLSQAFLSPIARYLRVRRPRLSRLSDASVPPPLHLRHDTAPAFLCTVTCYILVSHCQVPWSQAVATISLEGDEYLRRSPWKRDLAKLWSPFSRGQGLFCVGPL
jgi:hypothetical protein